MEYLQYLFCTTQKFKAPAEELLKCFFFSLLFFFPGTTVNSVVRSGTRTASWRVATGSSITTASSSSSTTPLTLTRASTPRAHTSPSTPTKKKEERINAHTILTTRSRTNSNKLNLFFGKRNAPPPPTVEEACQEIVFSPAGLGEQPNVVYLLCCYFLKMPFTVFAIPQQANDFLWKHQRLH